MHSVSNNDLRQPLRRKLGYVDVELIRDFGAPAIAALRRMASSSLVVGSLRGFGLASMRVAVRGLVMLDCNSDEIVLSLEGRLAGSHTPTHALHLMRVGARAASTRFCSAAH